MDKSKLGIKTKSRRGNKSRRSTTKRFSKHWWIRTIGIVVSILPVLVEALQKIERLLQGIGPGGTTLV